MVVGLTAIHHFVQPGECIPTRRAYAFGVIWSFTFNGLAMLVLRFKYKGERGWKVPPNFHIGKTEIPIGLAAVFLVSALYRDRQSVYEVDRNGGRCFLRRRILFDL